MNSSVRTVNVTGTIRSVQSLETFFIEKHYNPSRKVHQQSMCKFARSWQSANKFSFFRDTLQESGYACERIFHPVGMSRLVKTLSSYKPCIPAGWNGYRKLVSGLIFYSPSRVTSVGNCPSKSGQVNTGNPAIVKLRGIIAATLFRTVGL